MMNSFISIYTAYRDRKLNYLFGIRAMNYKNRVDIHFQLLLVSIYDAYTWRHIDHNICHGQSGKFLLKLPLARGGNPAGLELRT